VLGIIAKKRSKSKDQLSKPNARLRQERAWMPLNKSMMIFQKEMPQRLNFITNGSNRLFTIKKSM
jgi:hypothetical protein